MNYKKEEIMETTRTVKQAAVCICNNWCSEGQPTPYPLTSIDTPSKNVMGEYCEKCHFLDWENRTKP
ncbi:MAG: hypothetical protein US83_C0020G0001 [Candidatus Falkowbacteria bacterium GW2011_GWC2_38_22]|nr:MAG: hypothetical protein US83_C0020G0001 [Candidatus Falkowbacteria bacterium GW2011_GWC2_38_22]KKQ62376.1 MAG: hypothetical protein US84_C0018G0010 [Candidatus Falkowbacteria bacterium GW2011_GWF1_38_22]KKQ71582.1 MAG: hypothetical protein US93_C0017G0010 [Candidatus Falkowbacteria bacterium GW2011_GWD2_38_42]